MNKEHIIEQLVDDLNSSEPESSNKEKKTEVSPEIDDLLKETLSEFGLNLDKNRPSLHTKEEKPKPAITQAPAQAVKATKLPENGPLAEYAQPTKKPFQLPIPPLKLSLKKLKIPAPKILLPLVALAIIAGSSAFYIFKPHKTNSSPALKIEIKKPEIKQQLGQIPADMSLLEKQLGQEKDTTSSELPETKPSAPTSDQQQRESISSPSSQMKAKEQSQNEPVSAPEKKPSNQKSSSVNLPSEYIEPYLEAVQPELKLQQLPQAKKENDLSNSQNKKVTSSFLERYFLIEKKEPKQSSAKKETNTQGVKLGDLVPLQMVDFPPRIIRQVQPVYPSAALDIGLEGSVLINALISENGDVIKAVILKGIKSEFGLNKSAVNAVKQWKFRPALKDGIRVKVWKPIAIAFRKK